MFVMALDVGTSSARAVCVQADGRPLPGTEARVAYEPRITGDGGVEMDPEVLLAAVVEAVSACLAGCGARAGEIRGVGASMKQRLRCIEVPRPVDGGNVYFTAE